MGSYYRRNTARGGGLLRILQNRCGGWWEKVGGGYVFWLEGSWGGIMPGDREQSTLKHSTLAPLHPGTLAPPAYLTGSTVERAVHVNPGLSPFPLKLDRGTR